MKTDPILQVMKNWLNKQQEVWAVPSDGGQIVTILGKDITNVTRNDDGVNIAFTLSGRFRLLNEEHVAAMLMPCELEPADMQRISSDLHVNLRRVQGIDRLKHIVMIEGKTHPVHIKYWEQFILAYDRLQNSENYTDKL